MDRGRFFTRHDIDRGQGAGHGRDRLDRCTHAQHFTVGHAALRAAGTVGPADDPTIAERDLVMGFGTPACRRREAVSDFDALDRLDRHEGLGETSIEARLPGYVGAETGRHAVGENLDDAAESIAVLRGAADLLLHRLRRLGVEAACRILIEACRIARPRLLSILGHLDGADADNVGDELYACGLVEEAGRDLTEGNAGCCFACGCSLEHRPSIVEAVFHHADQVRVPGAGAGELLVAGDLPLIARPSIDEEVGGVDRVGAHDLRPLRPFGVADHESDRGTDRQPVADPGQDLQLVLLKLLSRASAGSQATPRKGGANVRALYFDPRGQSFDNPDEGGPM